MALQLLSCIFHRFLKLWSVYNKWCSSVWKFRSLFCLENGMFVCFRVSFCKWGPLAEPWFRSWFICGLLLCIVVSLQNNLDSTWDFYYSYTHSRNRKRWDFSFQLQILLLRNETVTLQCVSFTFEAWISHVIKAIHAFLTYWTIIPMWCNTENTLNLTRQIWI